MSEAAPTEDAAHIVLRNVAELAQRQQSREMGSSLARQIFRLLKVVQFHALDNMAVLQQLDQTVEALRAFGAHTGEPLTLLFAKSTVFVCGQLLKASRAEYESALELSEMVRRLGVTQLTIHTDAERADLAALARLFQPGAKVDTERGVLEPSPRVRLRYVSAAKLDENEHDLTPEEQILRTYATTVVVMRRVYENLMAGRYQLPNQVKRLAQRLVVLSEGDTPAYLGVTAMRNLNHDAAGRAVNRSILAVTMGRQLTHDLATLSRIAMSALFYDVATPLVTGVAGRGNEVVVARMTEHAERRLPAATAAVLTALGQLRDASRVRTVIAYEAHWLRQLDALGPVYEGTHRPMVAARIVAIAHRFNQLMEPDLGASHAPTVDDVIAKMRMEARDAVDQAMMVLLIGALGIFPRGSAVELTTGERGVVLRTPDVPADYARPSVRLVYDANGQLMRMKVAIDLARDPERQVARVITDPDPALLQACRAVEESAASASEPAPPPQATRDALEAFLSEPPAPAPTIQPAAQAPTVQPAAQAPTLAPQPKTPTSELPILEPYEESAALEPVLEPLPAVTPTPVPASSAPGSSLAERIRMRAQRARAAVEVVGAPKSRRDPRSEDWEPEPADPEVARLESLEISHAEPSDPSMHWRRAPATLPPTLSSVEGTVEQSHAPSASGSLERTPFSHVLIYVLERTLGGTLILTEPSAKDGDEPVEHAVFFEDGIPRKVQTGARIAALGSLLVAYGVLEQSELESEPISQPPVHEATLERELLELGLARTEQIAEIRNEQLAERLTFLFSLPPDTRYAFYNGYDLLQAVWGDIPGTVSPLEGLTRGLREHPEEAAMDRMLTTLTGHPLELHAEADVEVFGFSAEEQAVAAALASARPSVPDLIENGYDPDAVRRVVYELLLTHCVAPVAE